IALPVTHRLESACASCTPCHELALKDLSDSFPTSVTSPTFQVFEQLELDPEFELPLDPQATATISAAATTATRRNTLISHVLPVVSRIPRFRSHTGVASVYRQAAPIAKCLNRPFAVAARPCHSSGCSRTYVIRASRSGGSVPSSTSSSSA